MTKLSKSQRAALPARDFAGPGRSFPVNDPDHAHAALLDVGKSSLTRAEKAEVREEARKELHRSHPLPKSR